MPLNYSKWDALEVSDDSDIEGHPNVDHKSLVRWKQRDIHEKREARRQKIAALQAEIACNDVLLPRLANLESTLSSLPPSQVPSNFSAIVEKLKTQPSPEAPPTNAPNPTTYDMMIYSLMMKVWEDVKERGIGKVDGDEKLGEHLLKGLKEHQTKLTDVQKGLNEELASEEKEKNKKITSDDMHEGWDSKYVPAKPEPPPVSTKPIKPAKKVETTFEVLNPKGVEAGSSSSSSKPSSSTATTTSQPAKATNADDSDEDEDAESILPKMTPILVEFSKLPLKGFQESFEFIQAHRDVYVPGASDALLVAAFEAESDGKERYAKQCVHQSLLLQYCEKLGKDGVRLFFRRMTLGDPRAESVFLKDVDDTYNHLRQRIAISKSEQAKASSEQAGGAEQIQLVAQNANTIISFTIPDGPPPPQITLEGPGTEHLNPERVREMLQLRWDHFNSLSTEMQEALKSQELEKVNKVLGRMSVEEAEEVVRKLDEGGILDFAEGGIRDETGREGLGEEVDEGEDADEEDVD